MKFLGIVQNRPEDNNDDQFIERVSTQQQQIKIETPRGFYKSPDNVRYRKGYTLPQPECDGTLSSRCIEFKSFFNCVNGTKEEVFQKFLKDSLSFACGCLNKRYNGTIYFGIADNTVKKNEFENYKHGEIVGFKIDENGFNCKNKYTDELRKGIFLHFYGFTKDIAKDCISNPYFIEVVNSETGNCFVMEVDIHPSSVFCQNAYFKINLQKNKNKHKKREYEMYIRDGSSTILLDTNEKTEYIKKRLSRYIAYREKFEQKELKKGQNFLRYLIIFILFIVLVVVLFNMYVSCDFKNLSGKLISICSIIIPFWTEV